jgi:hypothetical protein
MHSVDLERNRTLWYWALAVLLLALGVRYSGPLWDVDLWWHLSSGKYFVHARAFMASDPFTFPESGGELSGTTSLNGYWLAQVILYGCYALFGYHGLIVLRASLLVGALFLACFTARRLGAPRWASLAFVALCGSLLVHFTGVRPQLFSLLLVPVLFLALEELHAGLGRGRISRGPALGLCMLMLIWASLHRGFLIGVAIMVVYAAVESMVFAVRRGYPGRRLASFWLIVLAATAVTVVNPNHYFSYLDLVRIVHKTQEWRSTEFLPPLTLAREYGLYFPLYWFLVAAVSTLLILSRRTMSMPHAALAVFLTGISLSSYRFIPFFLLLAVPVALSRTSGLLEGRGRLANAARGAALILVLTVVAQAFAGYRASLGSSTRDPVRSGRFPEGAAAFVLQNRPAGNIFNHYDWGGYLGWTLYPEYKVYIDGRNVSAQAFRDYTHMLWTRDASPMLLDRYGIQTVIMMPKNPVSGEPYAMLGFLREDPQWHLVYRDPLSLVYVRGKENRDIVYRFSMPK